MGLIAQPCWCSDVSQSTQRIIHKEKYSRLTEVQSIFIKCIIIIIFLIWPLKQKAWSIIDKHRFKINKDLFSGLRLRSTFTFKVKIWRHHSDILSTSGGTGNCMSTPNSAKKRRARVQGGWAAPTNVRSDRDKPKVPAGPAWLGKNVDQPVERKFVYEKPEEVMCSV